MGSIVVSTQVIEQPRSWKKTVHDFLAENDMKCKKAIPLQGGASAYIWKLEGLALGRGEATSDSNTSPVPEMCIMKFGDDTAKSVADIKMAPNRMSREAQAMTSDTLARVCLEEPSVEIPQLVRSVDQAVIMSWVGETDLRSAYMNNPDLDARDAGERIGRWLATMHKTGRKNPEVRDWTNSTFDVVRRLEEDNLRAKLSAGSILSSDDIQKALAVYDISDDVRTLTAYDFRPMNTLIRASDDPNRPRITIVDWEVSSYNDPAFDLRMWVAEAMILESQHGGGRGLLKGFLTSYSQTAGEDHANLDLACRVAVLIGSMWHLLMPCALWNCTEAEGTYWKGLGNEYIRAGAQKDRQWLLQSALAPLLY